jgi:hypothetical protein
MMMRERPNSLRGIIRFITRNGCHARRRGQTAKRAAMRPALADAVWDKDIPGATHRLDVKRNSWIVFDLSPQSRYLHVHGPLELQVEFLAQQRARE